MPNHTNIDKDFIKAVMTGFDETLSTDIREAIDDEIIAKLRKIAAMMKKAEAGWTEVVLTGRRMELQEITKWIFDNLNGEWLCSQPTDGNDQWAFEPTGTADSWVFEIAEEATLFLLRWA